jgi:pentatricopeptide repeat protein
MPAGSYSKEDWNDAIALVRFWGNQTTDEGVDKAWRLLDRLAEELRMMKRLNKNQEQIDELRGRTRKAAKDACQSWCDTPTAHFTARQLSERCFHDYLDVLDPVHPSLCRSIMRAATARQDKEGALVVTDMMLDCLHDLVDKGRKEFIPPSGVYADAMYVYCNMGGPDAGQKAETVLSRMQKFNQVQDDSHLHIKLYSEVITAYANAGGPDAGERALELLEDTKKRGLVPDLLLMNSVLNAIAKSDDEEATEKAEAFLESMEDTDTSSYNIVVAAYGRKSRLDKAEEVLARMFQRAKANSKIVPDCIVYNAVLDGLSKSGVPGAAIRAEGVLQKMYDLADKTGNEKLRPDRFSFNTVLHAWARSGEDYAAHRAEAILNRMQELADSGMDKVRPNVVSFSTVLDCWAKSRLKGASDRAVAILEKMVDLYKGGRIDVKPNVYTYTSVIDAIGNSDDDFAPERAGAVMRLMKEHAVVPSMHTYTAFISVFARSGRQNAWKKSLEIMDEMRELTSQGKALNPENSFVYTILLNSFARTGQPREAEKTLEYMEKCYQEGNEDMKPDRVAYGAVLSAWARSDEENAIDRALSIFRYMLKRHEEGDADFNLHSSMFNALLSAFAKQKGHKFAMHAEAFLKRMKSLAQQGDIACKPTSTTYGCVINSYTNSGHFKAVDRIFALLEEMHQSDDPACWPSSRTYAGAMRAISQSHIPDKFERAMSLLDLIEERGFVTFSVHHINSALRCCQNSALAASRNAAFDIWDKAIQSPHQVVPTSLTCELLLMSCLDERDGTERRKKIAEAYRRCCAAGLGTKRAVRHTLKRIAPHDYDSFMSMNV